MVIHRLKKGEEPPYDLLLLADPSKEMVDSYLHEGECYIAKMGAETIGVYVLVPLNKDTIELKNIAVKENWQGKGIGKQLVMDAIQSARNKGYETIEVGTGNSSIGQLALYQKCGFRITGIDFDFFTRNYPEEIYENGIRCSDMLRLTKKLR